MNVLGEWYLNFNFLIKGVKNLLLINFVDIVWSKVFVFICIMFVWLIMCW